ncbi:GNAT family N-acetyltransferase [Allofournierella sp.]|uniref:GNAT family N-acetyltransferase n=1 Tax=Allofournierella sp. TaxID=1940256 RepID=UPI003AB6119A
MPYVYMVRCENGALYTGWTTDLARRLAAHQSGTGAKYTKGFGAAALAWAEPQADKAAALRREAVVKKLPKEQKEALAAGFDPARFAVLRPARPADAAEVLAVFDHYVKNSTASFLYRAPAVEEYQREIRRLARSLPYLVAQDAEGRMLGYACAHPWRYGRDAYAWDAETTIYLAPGARRLGVGSMLYHALLAALAEEGYWNAYGVLADPNPESEAFHAAFGFVCEGRQARSGYKHGWQGVSYWLLALREGQQEPQALPGPLPKGRLEEILAAARLGRSWKEIAEGSPRAAARANTE